MNLEQIDTSTTAGKAEVMRLAAEGRRVVQRTSMIYRWVEIQPSWNWSAVEYAIISESVGPEEMWVAVYNDGSVSRQGTEDEVLSRRLDGKAAGIDSVVVRYVRADLAGEGK